MGTLTIEELYEQHIRPRPPEERARLVAMTTRDLAEQSTGEAAPQRSILELEGLGKEIWAGIDAQEYVNELRSEWDHRP